MAYMKLLLVALIMSVMVQPLYQYCKTKLRCLLEYVQ